MPIIQWDQSLFTNIASIDSQHKKLVDILNRLYDAMKVGKGSEVLDGVIKELIYYTKTHFADEEKLMIESKYTDYSSHFKQHTLFVDKVESAYKQFSEGKMGLSLELMYYLKEWLSTHIMGVDKKFGDYLLTQKK